MHTHTKKKKPKKFYTEMQILIKRPELFKNRLHTHGSPLNYFFLNTLHGSETVCVFV